MKIGENSWHAKVYGAITDGGMGRKVYRALLVAFCRKFRYTCQACRHRFSAPGGRLGLHHIIPRSVGGTDDAENLILLCQDCHDRVEVAPKRFKTRRQIEYAFAGSDNKRVSAQSIGMDWHEWVYGGAKNPLKATR